MGGPNSLESGVSAAGNQIGMPINRATKMHSAVVRILYTEEIALCFSTVSLLLNCLSLPTNKDEFA